LISVFHGSLEVEISVSINAWVEKINYGTKFDFPKPIFSLKKTSRNLLKFFAFLSMPETKNYASLSQKEESFESDTESYSGSEIEDEERRCDCACECCQGGLCYGDFTRSGSESD
jgi:hypothetical protein